MAGRVWFFDLDNTLAATSRFYRQAVDEFLDLMYELVFDDLRFLACARKYELVFDDLCFLACARKLDTFGWGVRDRSKIARLVRKIDNDRVEIHGNAPHRFPSSLVICYRQLCEEVGAPVDEKVVAQVRQIGENSFSLDLYLRDQLMPGVEETLDFLRAQGDELFVLTKGDPLVQWRKWIGYRLDRWFPTAREFWVVRWDPRLGYSGDKGPVLVELGEEYPGRTIYMVGDSTDSDMIPAVKANTILAGKAKIVAIYIPAPGKWSWRVVVSPLPPEAIVLKEIAEIIKRYKEL